MKYVWWFIYHPNAPSWVHLVLAVAWVILACVAFHMRGYSFPFVLYCCFAVARMTMAINQSEAAIKKGGK